MNSLIRKRSLPHKFPNGRNNFTARTAHEFLRVEIGIRMTPFSSTARSLTPEEQPIMWDSLELTSERGRLCGKFSSGFRQAIRGVRASVSVKSNLPIGQS